MSTTKERVPAGAYVRSAVVTVAVAVGALWLVRSLLEDGLVLLASSISAITVFLLIVYLRRTYSAMRWMADRRGAGGPVRRVPDRIQRLHRLHQHGRRPLDHQATVDRAAGIGAVPARGGVRRSRGRGTSRPMGTACCSPTPTRPASCPTAGGDETVELDPSGEAPATIGDYQLDGAQRDPAGPRHAGRASSSETRSARCGSNRSAAAAVSQPRYEYDEDADAIVDLAEDVAYPSRTKDRGWALTGQSSCPASSAPSATTTSSALSPTRACAHRCSACSPGTSPSRCFSVALSFGAGLAVSLLFEDLPGDAGTSAPC